LRRSSSYFSPWVFIERGVARVASADLRG